ncbi:MAG: NAD-dependent epimerase/dehydratase family protein, partial [Bacteroidetes bacterium]|nr:NAD-dependent epimerase/dehydratase family protein [Bacteroidota bacterium]
VLPAILRKMHLAKCLENNDLDSIRQDLNKRPIEKINGNASDEEIINILSKYGIEINDREAVSHAEENYTEKNSVSSVANLSLWGTGKPKREFLYVDDMADACVYLMENLNANDLYSMETTHINIGIGKDISISELTAMISNIIGYKGQIEFNISMPDGTPRKLLDIDRLHAIGWKEQVNIEKGIIETYNWYRMNI